MSTIIQSAGKSLKWVVSTLSGADSQVTRQDIPAQIGKWAFRAGTFWAGLLLPITLIVTAIFPFAFIACLFDHFHFGNWQQWLICPYLLSGYAIWVGWGWRSRQLRGLGRSSLFWLASAAYHVLQPIHFWMDARSIWVLFTPLALWGSVLTLASLVAMVWEFILPRNENQAVPLMPGQSGAQ